MPGSARAVIWDLDGVLVDSAAAHFEAWKTVCAEHGRTMTKAEFWATFGRRNPDILESLFGPLSPEEIAAISERKEAIFRELAPGRVIILPGARELVRAFAAAGWRQAIGTSTPAANLRLILEILDLPGCFGALVTAEDVSRGKPDPEVFLLAAQRLEVEPACCVVFEDAPAGIAAARTGGMATIAVTAGRDRLGYEIANLQVRELSEVTVGQIERLLERHSS